MWTYHQSTGLYELDGVEISYGWSGYEDAINIPAMQDIPGIGPIPRGIWAMLDPPFDDAECGPYCLRLTPALDTKTFCRNAFLCHGRSQARPFDSSKGCLIADLPTRTKMWKGGDHTLEAVA